MLPSLLPRLATDSAVRVFPGVWKLLSFLRLPSWEGSLSLPLLSLFLSFIRPPFKGNGLLFWVPDVLCRHSEVVLWNLLRVQMFFWRIWGGESGLPDLFLCHLRTASPTLFLWDLFMLLHVAVIYCFSLLRSSHCVNIPQSTCCTIDKHLNYV